MTRRPSPEALREAALATAYALAHRLACAGLHVTVHAPPDPGDWNDHLQNRSPE